MHLLRWAKRGFVGSIVAIMATVALMAPASPASASPESCATVIAGAAAGGPIGWGSSAVSSVYCGGWMGDVNAGYICWVSRQSWGHWAKGVVWLITWGRYTQC